MIWLCVLRPLNERWQVCESRLTLPRAAERAHPCSRRSRGWRCRGREISGACYKAELTLIARERESPPAPDRSFAPFDRSKGAKTLRVIRAASRSPPQSGDPLALLAMRQAAARRGFRSPRRDAAKSGFFCKFPLTSSAICDIIALPHAGEVFFWRDKNHPAPRRGRHGISDGATRCFARLTVRQRGSPRIFKEVPINES